MDAGAWMSLIATGIVLLIGAGLICYEHWGSGANQSREHDRTTPAEEAEAADAHGSADPSQPEPAVDLTTALQQSIEQRPGSRRTPIAVDRCLGFSVAAPGWGRLQRLTTFDSGCTGPCGRSATCASRAYGPRGVFRRGRERNHARVLVLWALIRDQRTLTTELPHPDLTLA